jgi:hypothetical protein
VGLLFPDLYEEYSTYMAKPYPENCRERQQAEFLFCTAVRMDHLPKHHVQHPDIEKNGWKAISAMRNWYHVSETNRILVLYWKKNPVQMIGPKLPVLNRKTYGTNLQKSKEEKFKWKLDTLQGTGCGFKVGEPPLNTFGYWRWFTLLRMPLRRQIPRLTKLWLKNRNFRYVDQGTMASYWVNGWPVRDYTYKKEFEYWQKYDPKLKFVYPNTGYYPIAP